MTVNQSAAIPGAAIGLAAIVVPLLVLPVGFISLAIAAGLVLVAYVVARFTAGKAVGEFSRGLLIGLNAALNFALGRLAYGALFGGAIGAVLAVVLCVINLLCVFHALSGSDVFQAFLGYLNLFLPMSWIVAGAGLLLFIVNLLAGAVGALAKSDYFSIRGMDADWSTGTFFTRSGFVANLNPIDTAFNMGNFAFVDKNRAAGIDKEHEAGHTLNLAAFGSVFHFVGVIDEMVAGGGANAFAERLAESNVPGRGTAPDVLGMWSS